MLNPVKIPGETLCTAHQPGGEGGGVTGIWLVLFAFNIPELKYHFETQNTVKTCLQRNLIIFTNASL